MRERLAQILKIVCIGLAPLLLVQLVKVACRVNPLASATIPQVPSLPADTNAAPAITANKPPGKPATNSPTAANGADNPAVATHTNALSLKKSKSQEKSTNQLSASNSETTNEPAISSPSPPRSGGEGRGEVVLSQSNTVSVVATNSDVTKTAESNTAPAITASTNTLVTNSTIALATHTAAAADTNITAAKSPISTNVVAGGTAKTNLTNSAMAKANGARTSAMMGSGPGGKTTAKLSPEVQARIDRVTESEILAPVMHPMPMALLGIAGKTALLRSPSGQTGLVKEGDDLGELKLLRIGTNRVLVEQDGQKKELMIFSGLGGESLMPKTTETSDETTKH